MRNGSSQRLCKGCGDIIISQELRPENKDFSVKRLARGQGMTSQCGNIISRAEWYLAIARCCVNLSLIPDWRYVLLLRQVF